MCVPTVCLCASVHLWRDLECGVSEVVADRKEKKKTELTTVVLDGDVFGRQLMLASHTNEQWTSSPAGTRMKQVGRKRQKEGEGERESTGKVG